MVELSNADSKVEMKTQIPGEAGIWAFVAGDLLVFSVFFILIALGHAEQTDIFEASRGTLDLRFGIANTLLLLTGSLFVAIGVERCRSMPSGKNKQWFLLGIGCGVGFVVNKIFEWNAKIEASYSPVTNDFHMYFFIFTGIHLIHVLVGLGVLLFLLRMSQRSNLSAREIQTLESGAIFWHLVDLLWIMLFALLYLL